jgi:hypothetical protein
MQRTHIGGEASHRKRRPSISHPHSNPEPALPASRTPWHRHALTLLVFALTFITLEVVSYTRESATWDEPVHVMDGYLTLARRDYRVDVEHPPLLRMWAALPLLGESIAADTRAIDNTTGYTWALNDVFIAAHQFMYVDNDADRMLYRARFMTVLLGVVLGVLVYAWGHAIFGWATAAALLAVFTMEPNIASHSRLVTTDLGVTLGIFGAVYFFWRLAARSWSWRALVGLAAFTTLALLSKFSGLLLLPVLAVLVIVARWRRAIDTRQVLITIGAVGVAAFVGIWACYGFRYLPSSNPAWRYNFHIEPFATGTMPVTTAVVRWIDDHRVLPNAYAEGLLLNQSRSQRRNAFLLGGFTETGWWYYFPVAFALKTPVVVLLLFGAGTYLAARRVPVDALHALVPIAIFGGVAMTATINIGVRHILPIYPFVVLLAGAAVSALLSAGRRIVATIAVAAALIEPALIYPHTLAFFNVLAGGASHGSEYLVDSNLDWGQDLKGLKAWMNAHAVSHINLAYFGFADPRYYGIDCTFLPGSPGWVRKEQLQLPRLPGYVAVSATLLRGVYAPSALDREFFEPLAKLTPVDSIGHSIFIFRVERPWY